MDCSRIGQMLEGGETGSASLSMFGLVVFQMTGVPEHSSSIYKGSFPVSKRKSDRLNQSYLSREL